MEYVWISATTYYISINFEFYQYILSFHFGTFKVSIIVVSEQNHSFFLKEVGSFCNQDLMCSNRKSEVSPGREPNYDVICTKARGLCGMKTLKICT